MRIENTAEGCPNGSIPRAGRQTYSTREAWTALKDLPQRVATLLKKYESTNAGGFEDFERELRALFAHTQCAVTEEALARHDVDLPFVFIDGERHRRACRCAQTYLTAAGPVSVTRTLYRARRGERAVAALERKVGIVEGYWTPLAARQGAMLVSLVVRIGCVRTPRSRVNHRPVRETRTCNTPDHEKKRSLFWWASLAPPGPVITARKPVSSILARSRETHRLFSRGAHGSEDWLGGVCGAMTSRDFGSRPAPEGEVHVR